MISYAELMGGKAFNPKFLGISRSRIRSLYEVVGTSTPREDIPRKVAGQPLYSGFSPAWHAACPPGASAECGCRVDFDWTRVRWLVCLVWSRLFSAITLLGSSLNAKSRLSLPPRQLKVEWRERPLCRPCRICTPPFVPSRRRIIC